MGNSPRWLLPDAPGSCAEAVDQWSSLAKQQIHERTLGANASSCGVEVGYSATNRAVALHGQGRRGLGRGMDLRSWRMIGRGAKWQATVRNPARAKVEA